MASSFARTRHCLLGRGPEPLGQRAPERPEPRSQREHAAGLRRSRGGQRATARHAGRAGGRGVPCFPPAGCRGAGDARRVSEAGFWESQPCAPASSQPPAPERAGHRGLGGPGAPVDVCDYSCRRNSTGASACAGEVGCVLQQKGLRCENAFARERKSVRKPSGSPVRGEQRTECERGNSHAQKVHGKSVFGKGFHAWSS